MNFTFTSTQFTSTFEYTIQRRTIHMNNFVLVKRSCSVYSVIINKYNTISASIGPMLCQPKCISSILHYNVWIFDDAKFAMQNGSQPYSKKPHTPWFHNNNNNNNGNKTFSLGQHFHFIKVTVQKTSHCRNFILKMVMVCSGSNALHYTPIDSFFLFHHQSKWMPWYRRRYLPTCVALSSKIK